MKHDNMILTWKHPITTWWNIQSRPVFHPLNLNDGLWYDNDVVIWKRFLHYWSCVRRILMGLYYGVSMFPLLLIWTSYWTNRGISPQNDDVLGFLWSYVINGPQIGVTGWLVMSSARVSTWEIPENHRRQLTSILQTMYLHIFVRMKVVVLWNKFQLNLSPRVLLTPNKHWFA